MKYKMVIHQNIVGIFDTLERAQKAVYDYDRCFGETPNIIKKQDKRYSYAIYDEDHTYLNRFDCPDMAESYKSLQQITLKKEGCYVQREELKTYGGKENE